MTEYLKSLSEDFNGNILPSQLHEEIIGNTTITTAFQGITSYLDDISIVFESALSNVEVNALNGIISNHIPDLAPQRVMAYRIFPETRKVKSDAWQSIVSFQFPGTKYNGDVHYIDVVSNAEIAGMTYQVQISQRSTNMVLATDTFENVLLDTNTIAILQPFPENRDIIDISVKSSNRNRNVNIQEVMFWYGN